VKPAAQWAQANLQAYQQREAGLRGQADAKRAELDGFRRDMLRAALESSQPAAAAAATGSVAAEVENISLI